MKCAWVGCEDGAEWEVWLEGKHKMPLCEEHVRNFQADKGERGKTRVGMVAQLGRGRYLIEGIGNAAGQGAAKPYPAPACSQSGSEEA